MKEYSDCCWADFTARRHAPHCSWYLTCDACGEKCTTLSEETVEEEKMKHHRLLKKLEEKHGEKFWGK